MFFIKSKIKWVYNKIARLNDATLPMSELLKPPFLNVDIQKGCVVSDDTIIGEYTYIGANTTLTKAVVGRYCSIANNVSIGDGEHILDKVSTSSYFYDDPYEVLTQKECIIGNDVWIGTKSIIRRGVKIGNGAVIGANSFVNKDVPEFAVVVGSPARIIKYRFNPTIIKLITKSNWWELSIDEAKKKVAYLQKQII